MRFRNVGYAAEPGGVISGIQGAMLFAEGEEPRGAFIACSRRVTLQTTSSASTLGLGRSVREKLGALLRD